MVDRIILGLCLLVSWVPAFADAITTEALLDEMTDLARLCELPEPFYITRQFSSYDRNSKSPTQDWFANGDCGQFIRVEEVAGRKENVLMDTAGPGAVVRIWSANPEGTLRIYIDGVTEPTLMADMQDLLGGRYPGLPKPLAGERARGWNLYFPIPYAKHCKITSDKGGFYYHVNYRTYAEDVSVSSFTVADLERLAGRIKEIADRLDDPRSAGRAPAAGEKQAFNVSVPAGGEADLGQLTGPRMIHEFVTRLSVDDTIAAARGVVLVMDFDGGQRVECPLGDFFGTAPGLNPYASLPLGVTKDDSPELWCHWRMPFEKTARIRVKNYNGQTATLTGHFVSTPYQWVTGRSLYFHAGWRIENNLPSRPWIDWTHLAAFGKGRFVGGMLHIQNPNRNWWGEGDEKIYLDEEAFPSTFGTGSEDYYGYAWCCPELFYHAYHNQTHASAPSNYGDASVNRFHILDDMPFRSAFRFDMENWHSMSTVLVNRAAVSYWYSLGGPASFEPITPAMVVYRPLPQLEVYRVAGVIEAEDMEVLADVDRLHKQVREKPWSNEKHLWWDADKPGDRLPLAFESPVGGRRHVRICLTRFNDYAQIQLYINDRKAGEVIDLYAPGAEITEEIDLGEFDLNKGRNHLTVEIVGANEAAKKRYIIGIDYIRIK